MKNLDLNGLGVQEMNATEMRATDGGWLADRFSPFGPVMDTYDPRYEMDCFGNVRIKPGFEVFVLNKTIF